MGAAAGGPAEAAWMLQPGAVGLSHHTLLVLAI
jgi:hypothetical protein